jgi:hypothetical protein
VYRHPPPFYLTLKGIFEDDKLVGDVNVLEEWSKNEYVVTASEDGEITLHDGRIFKPY